MPTKLTLAETQSFLTENPEWQVVDGKLDRNFKFKDFKQAFGFMAQVALIAEIACKYRDYCGGQDFGIFRSIGHGAASARRHRGSPAAAS